MFKIFVWLEENYIIYNVFYGFIDFVEVFFVIGEIFIEILGFVVSFVCFVI